MRVSLSLPLTADNQLSENDLAALRHFNLKVSKHLTQSAFEAIRLMCPESEIKTFKATQKHAATLAAYQPTPIDCCINSCCAFTRNHAARTTCPYCGEARRNSEGKPRKQFTYSPIIPRLVALTRDPEYRKLMQYRAEHDAAANPAKVDDVFDGTEYHRLKSEYVTNLDGAHAHKHFDNPRDIALGLSTDGFAPFRRRKQTCWPLILFNYNLPPDIRFHLEYILCVGVIPGPKKPKDFDSFLWPLIQELLRLEHGVRAYDIEEEEIFPLRAYLICIFGDIPAISMVMRMKGHNGFAPCRMCNITGVRVPGLRMPTLYVPLERSRHPAVQADPNAIREYDPTNLPLRSHEELTRQAREVDTAETEADAGRLSTKYGIKGTSVLSTLSSVSFPNSFPFDFMHLIYENVLKNLVLLWTGCYKDLDTGTGAYQLNPKVWDAIGAATAASGSTIPGAFGARPRNVADDKASCTADMWSFWLLYLGPVLLSQKFERDVYYTHFIELVKLVNLCVQFELSRQDIDTIRTGFQDWVKTYEK